MLYRAYTYIPRVYTPVFPDSGAKCNGPGSPAKIETVIIFEINDLLLSVHVEINKRPDGLYSSAETLQKLANKIIWGGLIIYKTV